MLAGLLSIPQVTPPLIYLGVPFFFGSPRHRFFNRILGSIKARLTGWKLRCLSFAGRLNLVKHVLSSIPLHISLAIPIPSKTCLSIERLKRNFLWSGSSETTRSNLVKWETTCLPKPEGGLGLRRIKEFNEASLLKLGWSAATADSLWAFWFCARYFKDSSIWFFGNPIGGSCIWRRLHSLSSFLQEGSKWQVVNGLSISLWYDHWIDQASISSRFPSIQFSPSDRVIDIIQENSWNIPSSLPGDLMDFLLLSTGDILIPKSRLPFHRHSLLDGFFSFG